MNIKRRLAVTVLTACLAAPMPGMTHDKCDSGAIAATAAGIFWAPLAAIQVGYFVAKQIDESTSNASFPDDVLDSQCLAQGNFGVIDAEQYLAIVSPNNEDPNLKYKFLWDVAGTLTQAALALNQSVTDWQAAREALRMAQIGGDPRAIAEAERKLNALWQAARNNLEIYRDQHGTFSDAMIQAARMFEADPPPVEPLFVDDIVRFAEEMLASGAPVFERQYFEQIACIRPEVVDDPELIMAPTVRFVKDGVPPGTFLTDKILASPTALYTAVADTFANEVGPDLDRILPPGFANNEHLPVEIQVIAEGVIGENNLGLKESTAFEVDFMLDLALEPVSPNIFIDPWRWHWVVGRPWDWLNGFQIEVIPEFDPVPPVNGPIDLLRVTATFDSDDDMVMELGFGSQFVQELFFEDGSLVSAAREGRLPNDSEMMNFVAGRFAIMDETGADRLMGTFDRVNPNPSHMPLTLNGTIGDNQLGIAPGTTQQVSMIIDTRLTPDGIRFHDPWWWHWLVGQDPWDWLRGFDIFIEQAVPRPGPDPDPWDRLRIITTFDDARVDMVMELPEGTQFIQDLYFPVGWLKTKRLPNPFEMSKFAGGDFQIVDPQGVILLEGSFKSLEMVAVDSDGDGVNDFEDNCATEANDDQRDTDGDGYGNLCDPDFDNSGTVDFSDLAFMKSVFFKADRDADLNGDGRVDFADLAILKSLFFRPPGPSAIGMGFFF